MFEIAQLKEMKLPELQEISKELNVPKYRSLKKEDLVYKILDHQAANPTIVTEVATDAVKPVRLDSCLLDQVSDGGLVEAILLSATSWTWQGTIRHPPDNQAWISLLERPSAGACPCDERCTGLHRT